MHCMHCYIIYIYILTVAYAMSPVCTVLYGISLKAQVCAPPGADSVRASVILLTKLVKAIHTVDNTALLAYNGYVFCIKNTYQTVVPSAERLFVEYKCSAPLLRYRVTSLRRRTPPVKNFPSGITTLPPTFKKHSSIAFVYSRYTCHRLVLHRNL